MKITDVRGEIYRWPRHKPITNGLYTYTHTGISPVFIDTDEGVSALFFLVFTYRVWGVLGYLAQIVASWL